MPSGDTAFDDRRIGRATFINLVGLGVPTVAVLISVPLYLRLIGEARYGVLLLALSLLTYFTAFDLGLGRAITQRMAGMLDLTARNRTFWTALILSAATGVVGALALYLIAGWLFPYVFDVDRSLQVEAEAALPWLAASVPLCSVASVLAGALQARQAFVALNVTQVIGLVGIQMLPLVAAAAGHADITFLIGATLVGRLLGVAVSFWAAARVLPFQGRPGLHRDEVKPLLRFGAWVSASYAVIPLLSIIDRVVISTKLGVAAVTAYTIPFNLTQRFTYLPAGLSTTIYPRLASSDEHASRDLMCESIVGLIALQTSLIVSGMVLMRPFLSFWIGPELADTATPIAIVFLASIWMNGPAHIPGHYMLARGRPELMTKFYLLEFVPFVALLWLLVGWLGIFGAALAWTARSLADAIFCFVATQTMIVFLRAILPTVPLIAAAIATATVPMPSWLRVSLGALTIAAAMLVSYRCLPPTWRWRSLFRGASR